MGIDLCGMGWGEDAKTREAPVDARHVEALKASVLARNGGDRVPDARLCDKVRSLARDAERLEAKGARSALNAVRNVLKARLGELPEYGMPEADATYDEQLSSAPLKGSDEANRTMYG